ncbi:translation initiation factor IF-2 [Rhodospirillum rubrum F11]|uniref:Translation initiation factor IF-2 n=4 Tax=Rhodospirillum rubrum TaxID=1085 RepID=IF2_RHORT|nr:translation initiation factor IF-2 [Rhodospirillum rubrum]Q2RMS0.2 RecName: Full=Translation initiation factor IF-2 [Rhodospirillum rubrum ATCC 11170]AEO50328.1 translation initiation factor IF-2 [Rhodospirillum rubrum F11]QXG80489.1 translation initiation factor IF-2 [Rhodospirillum rubrum]
MTNDKDRKAPLSLSPKGKLELKKSAETGQVRQSFSHGRSKVVQVEVRKSKKRPATSGDPAAVQNAIRGAAVFDTGLTSEEMQGRRRAVEEAVVRAAEEAERKRLEEIERRRREEEEARLKVEEEARRKAEEEAARAARAAAGDAAETPAEDVAPAAPQVAAAPQAPAPAPTRSGPRPGPDASARPAAEAPRSPTEAPRPGPRRVVEDEDDDAPKKVASRGAVPPKPAPAKRVEPKRRGKLTVTAALEGDERSERGRSVAALRRAKQKEKRKAEMMSPAERVVREVIIPDVINVQELANRMAERGANVIKTLMKMGVMATINQTIDADTAELVVAEFGHASRRVSDSDVELGLGDALPDGTEVLTSRPPVVTVMGHVDHGKTSLLDAMRKTDVAGGEAGGITQHIGAYQVVTKSGQKITFIDTPGHAAFTAMRARGARVTDIVVLVVAANDGIMPQTIEAIRHARAAEVPVVVAINKMDLPDANPEKVRTDLLQHELVVEQLGGDVLNVEVSAKRRLNLDKLEEAILLQSEILDLKANADRACQGVVIEAKVEKGRGSVATILVQKGTLKVGDIFVAGAEWGRVRALVDDHGNRVIAATPAMPVEVLGFQGTPAAGDDFIVVEDENRAREISEYRQRKDRDAQQVRTARGTMEQMFERIQAGEARELPVVIKADVQGSVEALVGTLEKLGNDDVKIRVLHAAVGAINESDVTLAKASDGLIIGFNVRANPQAREMARRDGIDIRYHSIIYAVADEVKALLSGMLEPTFKESFIGYAAIREVFNITKVGKVAGCMVTEGIVKRGAKVRLLRDNVVIHEGSLSQLKRFKDDVREVREGYECGMSFETYNDIQVGDVIECFEMEEVAAVL